MHLGKHVITHAFQDFDLSEDNLKELNSVGGKHWFISEDEKPAKKEVKKLKKKIKKEDK